MTKSLRGPKQPREAQGRSEIIDKRLRFLSTNVHDETLRGLRRDALACVSAALRAVDSETLVKETLRTRGRTLEVQGRSFPLEGRTVYLLALGKAAGPMARAASKLLRSPRASPFRIDLRLDRGPIAFDGFADRTHFRVAGASRPAKRPST